MAAGRKNAGRRDDKLQGESDWALALDAGEHAEKLTERFALSEDGKNLIYSGVLEDPVYLAKPVEWTGKWEYRPTMKPSNEKCNIEVASRFLSQDK